MATQTQLETQTRHRHDGIPLTPLSPNASRTDVGDEEPGLDHGHADDGYDTKEGWPVVAAGSAIFFVYLGLVYSYGVVQLHLLEARLASVSTLSFIGSVAASVNPLTGMLVARIIARIGYRATAMTGSFLLGLGEFTAGFSTGSVPAMFVTQGFVFGAGAALLFLVSRLAAWVFVSLLAFQISGLS